MQKALRSQALQARLLLIWSWKKLEIRLSNAVSQNLKKKVKRTSEATGLKYFVDDLTN